MPGIEEDLRAWIPALSGWAGKSYKLLGAKLISSQYLKNPVVLLLEIYLKGIIRNVN